MPNEQRSWRMGKGLWLVILLGCIGIPDCDFTCICRLMDRSINYAAAMIHIECVQNVQP